MGMHSDAMLCFGVDLGEENPLLSYDEEGPEDIPEFVLHNQGGINPYSEYPEVPQDVQGDWTNRYQREKAWIAENHPDWCKRTDEYRAELKKIENAAPVELQYYGYSDGYNCYILALKGTVQRASEYSCEPLKKSIQELLERPVHPPRTEAAKDYCQKNKLPSFDDPKWLLSSSYG